MRRCYAPERLIPLVQLASHRSRVEAGGSPRQGGAGRTDRPQIHHIGGGARASWCIDTPLIDTGVEPDEDNYYQERLDLVEHARVVRERLGGRAKRYSPMKVTGITEALSYLSGWSFTERWIVAHVVNCMGGRILEGLDLPGAWDTSVQIGEATNTAPGTVRNALSKATREGILESRPGRALARYTKSGEPYWRWAPGRARGSRVLVPGVNLIAALEELGAWPLKQHGP